MEMESGAFFYKEQPLTKILDDPNILKSVKEKFAREYLFFAILNDPLPTILCACK
jgi:hypothetical protein